MNKKLEGYTAEEISEEEKAERLEAKELEADPEVIVPTGDEEQPVAGSDHEASLKTLYAKGRRNRKLMTREDAEAVDDVAMMQKMVAEAAGGGDPSSELDTNRNMTDMEEEELAAQRAGEEEEELPLVEIDDDPKGEEESDALTGADPDAKVQVKILGKEYEVPQQDVDDAGGTELYQKTRAANMRLLRASTLEQGAIKTRADAEALIEEQQANPPIPDGQGEADIDSLRDELMDTVIDGTEDDINKWLEEHTQRRPAVSTPTPKPTDDPPAVIQRIQPEETETQQELRRQFYDDRQDTNDMMRTTYSDIMNDSELLDLAQRQFQVLATREDSEGRTQKEMARESAEYVRGLGRRILGDQKLVVSELEQKRRDRIERKRVLPQPSQADAPAPDNRPKPKKVPTAKEHLMRLRRHAGQEPPL